MPVTQPNGAEGTIAECSEDGKGAKGGLKVGEERYMKWRKKRTYYLRSHQVPGGCPGWRDWGCRGGRKGPLGMH